MLLRPDSDSAVYTANFEEIDHKSVASDENIVWEGHGLTSWILNDNNHNETSVTARLTKSNQEQDSYIAEVILQLHPVSGPFSLFRRMQDHADKPTIFRHIALPRPISTNR